MTCEYSTPEVDCAGQSGQRKDSIVMRRSIAVFVFVILLIASKSSAQNTAQAASPATCSRTRRCLSSSCADASAPGSTKAPRRRAEASSGLNGSPGVRAPSLPPVGRAVDLTPGELGSRGDLVASAQLHDQIGSAGRCARHRGATTGTGIPTLRLEWPSGTVVSR